MKGCIIAFNKHVLQSLEHLASDSGSPMVPFVAKPFFVSFFEETIQKLPTEISPPTFMLLEPLPSSTLDILKAICTSLCYMLFNDARPLLRKKDDNNFVIITKSLGLYSVYKFNEPVYKQKTRKMLRIYAIVIQNVFLRCSNKPETSAVEEDERLYIHLVFSR